MSCPICLENDKEPGEKYCAECKRDMESQGFLFGEPTVCENGVPCFKYDNVDYEDTCGPFYHEHQQGGVLCGYFAVNNMLGSHVVTPDTIQTLSMLFAKKRIREWFTGKLFQAREQGLFNSLTIGFIKDGLLYNVDRIVQLKDVCSAQEQDIDFLSKYLLPVFA